jgi:hypothetical protein
VILKIVSQAVDEENFPESNEQAPIRKVVISLYWPDFQYFLAALKYGGKNFK